MLSFSEELEGSSHWVDLEIDGSVWGEINII